MQRGKRVLKYKKGFKWESLALFYDWTNFRQKWSNMWWDLFWEQVKSTGYD